MIILLVFSAFFLLLMPKYKTCACQEIWKYFEDSVPHFYQTHHNTRPPRRLGVPAPQLHNPLLCVLLCTNPQAPSTPSSILCAAMQGLTWWRELLKRWPAGQPVGAAGREEDQAEAEVLHMVKGGEETPNHHQTSVQVSARGFFFQTCVLSFCLSSWSVKRVLPFSFNRAYISLEHVTARQAEPLFPAGVRTGAKFTFTRKLVWTVWTRSKAAGRERRNAADSLTHVLNLYSPLLIEAVCAGGLFFLPSRSEQGKLWKAASHRGSDKGGDEFQKGG